MTARESAGQRALREAARLEAARVYGGVVKETKNAPSITALVAEAELAARPQPVHEPSAQPVETPSETVDSPEAALRAGRPIRWVMDAYGLDYARAREIKRRIEKQAS